MHKRQIIWFEIHFPLRLTPCLLLLQARKHTHARAGTHTLKSQCSGEGNKVNLMCIMWVTSVPQAIINSTISPNMTFTKTSQKFGQWADSRANTVYGLGFSTEHHLTKVYTHTHTDVMHFMKAELWLGLISQLICGTTSRESLVESPDLQH